jgi:trimethylamine:corrinoid methyltransferase-like protein
LDTRLSLLRSDLDHKIDSALWAADHNIPVVYLGGPTVGLESPITRTSGLVIYLAAALSGAGLVHDLGFLDCADIGSLELLVLSNEVIGYVKRIMRGIEVNQDTIMMELIEKVGPGGLSMEKRVRVRAKEIYDHYKSPEISPEILAKIQEILDSEERRLIV